MKLCACGCGGKIKGSSTWRRGHNVRGRADNFIDLPEQPYVFPSVNQSVFTAEQQVVTSVRLIVKDNPVSIQANSSATPAALKVYIYPTANPEDTGGIPQVIKGQFRHLPKFGIDLVDNEEDADVIVCHVIIPPAFVKRFPRKPIVVINHGLYWADYEWFGSAFQKTNSDAMEAIRVSDAVAACSDWVANSIRRHTSRTVEVINHGIDIEDWQPLEQKGYVLWNKTRPDPVCDPEPMNQVAALLPNVRFISSFGQEAPNVALTSKLPFDQSKKLIQQAGVYLCTTRETFGIGTLEAMACGVPIVGYAWGGQAEFIEHGVDGWLVTPGDIDGLAEGIKTVIANKAAYSGAARRKAETFSWDKACERYSVLFKKTFELKNCQGPRTSIIVTNYNLHQYLPDCLDSVLKQSDEDWECIIVDDASTEPEGRKIAKDLSNLDSRFKLIVNEKNSYLSEARNVGIRMARGRYILPLDADDMLAPDAVAILADALDTDRSIHVAYGGVLFIEEDGTLSEYGKGFTPGHSSGPYPFSHEQQIMQRNLLPYASMYRREAWEQTGGYRRRCRTAEDADMWTRFSSYGFRPRMVTTVDTLIYRNRAGSMSRTNNTEWIRWFSWTKLISITPAGAATKEQLPIPSLDPIIISVIIPVGPGHEKLCTDAIDSVDTQSFRNWECILINDTGKPLETELPSWVRVLTTEGKTGPAHARNTGIKASRGRLFLPLDADDYLEPDALQFMYDAYQQNHDVIYTDFWQTDMNGKNLNIHQCDDYDPKLITGGRRTVNGKTREGMLHTVTALTPKSAWEKIGGYDESLPAWEDWDFQIALGNIGICSNRVALPLFVYRKHTGYRREQNYEFFKQSKEGIIRKWGALWEGGKELMACSSCGARRAVTPMSSQQQQNMVSKAQNNEAVLIEYVGNKQGATPYRGNSKTVYWFAAGDKKFVLAQDVDVFMQYPGQFKVIHPQAQILQAMNSPLLIAEGQA